MVTGRGEKAFCAGGDLKDRDGMTDEQWQQQHAIFEQVVRGMRDCPIPIIAAVLMIVHFWRVRKDGAISGPAPVMLESEIKPIKKK